MPSNLSEGEKARAAAALAIADAVEALNDAMAAAAKRGVYAKLSIYTLPAEPGKPRQTYAFSIVDLDKPAAR